ncbi:MAG: FtsW/RodA/SpoVE family cell cycle protein [Oscillospiraceae bacterium]|nr:FtsW/RodA/SpoVE family cell cycle protein [Oscillospiraceae bacterium]
MIGFLKNIHDYFKKYDLILWVVSLFISIYCLLLMVSVSVEGVNFFITQLIAVIIGYIGAIFLAEFDYHILAKYWQIVVTLCCGLMLSTLVLGSTIEGASGVNAKAWLRIFGVGFQPSELGKIGFIITLATHLDFLMKEKMMKSFLHIFLLGVHLIVPVAITKLQGDDGAGVIFICIFLVMCFSAGVQLRYFLCLFSVVTAAMPLIWRFVFSDYQKQRILVMLDLENHKLDKGFQQIQGMISIGSGKIFGQGLFMSPRVKSGIVPMQENDFILSVIGEQLGFVGCTLALISLAVLTFAVFKNGMKACDNLGALMCFGFFGLLFLQTIFNLGMCLNILPVMGVTLPFFSSGGSSAACLYLGLGIAQSVYSKRGDSDLVSIGKNTTILS